MWCIGFIEQWPLDHAKVLYTLESMSMVQSQKGGLHTPGHKEETSRETQHVSDLASEVFGVERSCEWLAAERMDRPSSESGFPDKRKKTELIFF